MVFITSILNLQHTLHSLLNPNSQITILIHILKDAHRGKKICSVVSDWKIDDENFDYRNSARYHRQKNTRYLSMELYTDKNYVKVPYKNCRYHPKFSKKVHRQWKEVEFFAPIF